jgi:hypothetical protein
MLVVISKRKDTDEGSSVMLGLITTLSRSEDVGHKKHGHPTKGFEENERDGKG